MVSGLSSRLLRLVTSATIALATCAAGPSPSTAPFLINVIVSESGPAAFLGKSEATALHVLESKVNREGGIRGQPIHFEVSDDQSRPQIAVQLMDAVIAKHAAVVLGGTLIATCGAMAPLTAGGSLVEYCLSPGVPTTPEGNVFASFMSLESYWAGVLHYLNLRGLRRIALFSAIDATGQRTERVIDKLFASGVEGGLQLVVREHFDLNDVSVAAQAGHIKASNPQVVLVLVTGPALGTVFRGLNDTGLDIPVLTSSANANPDQLKPYASFIPSEYLLTGNLYDLPPQELRSAAARRPVEEFLQAYHTEGVDPTPPSVTAWDPAGIVVSAFRKLGTAATAAQIKNYVAGLRGYAGVTGAYDFPRLNDQHGLTAESALVVVRWDPKNAVFVPVSKIGGIPR